MKINKTLKKYQLPKPDITREYEAVYNIDINLRIFVYKDSFKLYQYDGIDFRMYIKTDNEFLALRAMILLLKKQIFTPEVENEK